MNNGVIKTLIICVCIAAAGAAYVIGGSAPESTQIVSANTDFGSEEEADGQQESAERGESSERPEDTQGTEDAKGQESAAAGFFVHVCGEVKAPGVYELEAGSRVYEAINMAGGYTERAAADFLNMARQVEDGMKIEVPDKETAKTLSETAVAADSGVAAQEEHTGKVNLNTAAKEQLMTLRGIGEAKADDIIAYRSQNGPFERIEDIMKVSGIKEAAFQKIKDNITV